MKIIFAAKKKFVTNNLFSLIIKLFNCVTRRKKSSKSVSLMY